MKTLKLFVVFALFCTAATNAQISKGSYLMGGNLNLSYNDSYVYSNNDRYKDHVTILNLNFTGGYFVIDKLAVGITPSVSLSAFKYMHNTSTTVALGPFIRYYFLKTENKINVFANLDYQYSASFFRGNTYDEFSRVGFKAGPSFFINKSIAIEVTANYNYQGTNYRNNNTASENYSSLSLGVGFQIHLDRSNKDEVVPVAQ